jgi:hypothetical protein
MTRIRIRPALVFAIAWLLVSMVVTLLLAPRLGARGLLWLGFQDAACLFGCGWELRRAWRVQQQLTDRFAEE